MVNPESEKEGRKPTEAALPIIDLPSVPHADQKPPAESGDAPEDECSEIAGDARKKHWMRLLKGKPDRLIELVLAFAITFFAAAQWITSCTNNASTGKQVDKLLVAADRVDDAAESFSRSASGINGGVSDAVTKLQTQADKMDAARDASGKIATDALQATIANFHQDQRAWLTVQPAEGMPVSGQQFKIHIRLTNTGKTPAQKVMVYYDANYFHSNEEIVTKTRNPPMPLAPISPGVTQFTVIDNHRLPIPDLSVVVWSVFGAITYDDAHGDHHWVTYCSLWSESHYVYCSRHNEEGDGPLPPKELN